MQKLTEEPGPARRVRELMARNWRKDRFALCEWEMRDFFSSDYCKGVHEVLDVSSVVRVQSKHENKEKIGNVALSLYSMRGFKRTCAFRSGVNLI